MFSDFSGLIGHKLTMILIQSLSSIIIISFFFCKNKWEKKVAAEG